MPRTLETLTLADAKQMLEAGEAKAASLGIPYNIAVVDAGGALITFTRQDGRPFGLQQLQGRPFVANFIFTRCPTVCPAFTRKMARVQKDTDAFGPTLQLVSFSVDAT